MNEKLRSVLLVEASALQREELAGRLRKEIDCVVHAVGSADEAVEILAGGEVCVLIIGLDLALYEGLPLHKFVMSHHSQVLVLPVVPLGNQQKIAEVLQSGAYSYINAPYNFTEAVIVTARTLYFYDLLFHQEKRGAKVRKSDGFYGIIGKSRQMEEIYDLIGKLAEDSSTVLIQGESGTGKELVARALHTHSHRSLKNFVPINCAAIPEDLLESELFGYRKGAFTGALLTKIGHIQYADGGTLFLDEIGDMQPNLQAKLLRVIQDRTFVPVGGLEPVPVDVRIIAATHRDLEAQVAAGQFREDLYYRLSVIPLIMPPLRERQGDIPLLLDKFTQIFNRNRTSRLQGFTPEALAALRLYPWPGNVRELENLVQRLVVLHGGRTVGLNELPAKYLPPQTPLLSAAAPTLTEIDFGAEGIDFDAAIRDLEEKLILKALQVTDGNKKEAARLLHLNRTTLLEKIKKKGLDLK
jgi:DNA-binding NtrC family response regulator